MSKFNACGMKEEAMGVVSVEVVADNGYSKTFTVCTMHSQLMSATSEGREKESCVAVFYGEHFVECCCLLTSFLINLLHGAVEKIGREGKGDNP